MKCGLVMPGVKKYTVHEDNTTLSQLETTGESLQAMKDSPAPLESVRGTVQNNLLTKNRYRRIEYAVRSLTPQGASRDDRKQRIPAGFPPPAPVS